MVLHKRLLILEDNLLVLSKILAKLSQLEGDQPFDLSLTIMTDYQQVEDYINPNPNAQFDIILLDRDDKLNRSFHILDIERLGVDKVIGISSVTEYNDELRKRGVTKIVEKDLSNIEKFTEKVSYEVMEILNKIPLV